MIITLFKHRTLAQEHFNSQMGKYLFVMTNYTNVAEFTLQNTCRTNFTASWLSKNKKKKKTN